MDNKRLIIILSVWTVIFTLMGGTLAYWNWQSADNRKTNVTFTVNRDYTCGADSGGHITSNDVKLAPAKCNDSVYAIKRPITTSVTTTGDKVVNMDLWLNINNISTNLTNTSNFKWVIGKNGNSCESGIIKQGDFRNIQNNKIDLLDGVEYATLDDKYYLYIWLDEAETNANTMNQSFDFSISGKCEDNGLEKALLKSLDTTDYFREDDYKTKITDISFIYDKDLPSGITTNNEKIYDLGQNASKPITGYLITNTDEGAVEDTYKLYVSSEYKIYAQNLANAFNGMTALKNIMFNNFDTSGTTSMYGTFQNCSSLFSLNLSNFNTLNVIYFGAGAGSNGGAFQGLSSLSSLDVSYFDTSNAKYMANMFSECSGLTSLDLSNFDTSNVTNMYRMFYNCSNLTNLDLSSFNTSNVTTMRSMFDGCRGLISLNLSNFNTAKVTNMQTMFKNCSSLTSLDISNFDISSVTSMMYMFQNCSNLATLDLSSFGTFKANASISYMFYSCSQLKTIYVSNLWDISNVTNDGTYMFHGCTNLVGGAGTTYNSSYRDKTYARIDNPPDSPGYFTYKAF